MRRACRRGAVPIKANQSDLSHEGNRTKKMSASSPKILIGTDSMEEREGNAAPSTEMLACIRAVVEDVLSRRSGHSTDTVVPADGGGTSHSSDNDARDPPAGECTTWLVIGISYFRDGS